MVEVQALSHANAMDLYRPADCGARAMDFLASPDSPALLAAGCPFASDLAIIGVTTMPLPLLETDFRVNGQSRPLCEVTISLIFYEAIYQSRPANAIPQQPFSPSGPFLIHGSSEPLPDRVPAILTT